MIKLKVINQGGETEYTCQNCGAKEYFHIISPHICVRCDKRIPNLRKLKTDIKARYLYYLSDG